MKPIRVDFVPQHLQRYDTVGDYGEDAAGIWFRITAFPDRPAYSWAILLHELHEFFRVKQAGIPVEDIDTFDLTHPELDDPGLDPRAPYHSQHMEADALERLFIVQTGEDWVEYEAAVEALFTEEADP